MARISIYRDLVWLNNSDQDLSTKKKDNEELSHQTSSMHSVYTEKPLMRGKKNR